MPRIDTLVKLATALEIPPGGLIEGIAWTPGTTEAGAFTITSRAELERRVNWELGSSKAVEIASIDRHSVLGATG